MSSAENTYRLIWISDGECQAAQVGWIDERYRSAPDPAEAVFKALTNKAIATGWILSPEGAQSLIPGVLTALGVPSPSPTRSDNA